jgi:Glycosyltransferase Family 4
MVGSPRVSLASSPATQPDLDRWSTPVPQVTATDSESARIPASGIITVASAPAAHPYVRQVCAAPGIALLPDPPVPGRAPDVWWPPAVLDAEWITSHRDRAQILHIHFGTESFAAGQLTKVIAAAHGVGWSVVFTAHDLDHPQLGDQDAYRAQLEELFGGADAIITLTEGAAQVIQERWHRKASVIPHPSVLAPDAVIPRVRASDELRIGAHLKDLRPNVDGPGTARALMDAVAGLRRDGIPAMAEIRLHHRVRDERAREDVRRLCAQDEHAILIEHERLSDAELTIALSRLDAYVLPYRHGTHSGWLELCWDLGVPVAAPALGFYAEQRVDGSVAEFVPDDSATLTEALKSLLADDAATRPGTVERFAVVSARRDARSGTDAAVADAHAALYRRLLEERA